MPEDVTLKVKFDTSGIAGPLGGGRGRGAAARPAGGGGAGGLLGGGFLSSVGKIASGVGLALGALEGIKKASEALVQASPRLQQSIQIMGKGIMLMLRPIGDLLAMWLRPLAIAFLRYAVKFYRGFKGFGAPGEPTEAVAAAAGAEAGVEGIRAFSELRTQIRESTGPAGELSNILETGTIIWQILKDTLEGIWGVLKGVAGILILVGKGLLFLLNEALGPFVPVLELLANLWSALMGFLSDLGDAIFDLATGEIDFSEFVARFKEAFAEMVAGAIESVKIFFQRIIESFNKFKEDWVKFIELMKKIWAEAVDWIGMHVIEPIKEGFGTIVRWISSNVIQPIIGIWSNLVDKIVNMISRIPIVGRLAGRRQAGGSVGLGQSFMVGEAGPEIFRPNQSGTIVPNNQIGGGGPTNVTVNINAIDAESISSSVIDKITSAIEDNTKRGFSQRTTELLGI